MVRPFTEARILVADDNADNLYVLSEIVRRAGYTNIKLTQDARQVTPLFTTFHPDLVVLDLRMPYMDGFEVMEQLIPRMSSDSPVPILIVTGDDDPAARNRGLALGAKDFITKPYDPSEIGLRIKNLLEMRSLLLRVRNQKRLLEEEVRSQTQELEEARTEILERLALAAEYRDDATGKHTQRVGLLSSHIAAGLGMPDDEVELIRKAAPLHDIGKIAIPDAILLKPGPLTPVEFEQVKRHTEVGARMMRGSGVPLLQMAEEIALTHHERWDGGGYMNLRAEETPLIGRIVAVADVYDALLSDRPYKTAWEPKDAVNEIASQSGKQFDPKVVEAFVDVLEQHPIDDQDFNDRPLAIVLP